MDETAAGQRKYDYARIKKYFASNYHHSCPEHPYVEIEAEVYSSMVAAIMEYYNSRPIPERINNEAIMCAYANAAVYALGIHDPKQAENTGAIIMKIAQKNQT